MLFINWWIVGGTILALLMIAAGVVGLGKAKNLTRRTARFGVQIVSVPVAVAGILLALLLLLPTMSGCERVSAPIYSPSGRIAVRVYDFDEGATGGAASVEVFWARGFRRSNVFSAPWEAVEPSGIHWISDSEMTIEYSGGAADHIYCASTAAVKIVCNAK
jgi:hypothetical protein